MELAPSESDRNRWLQCTKFPLILTLFLTKRPCLALESGADDLPDEWRARTLSPSSTCPAFQVNSPRDIRRSRPRPLAPWVKGFGGNLRAAEGLDWALRPSKDQCPGDAERIHGGACQTARKRQTGLMESTSEGFSVGQRASRIQLQAGGFILSLLLIGTGPAAQGAPFQNLDFEAPLIDTGIPIGLEPYDLFSIPGWTAYAAGTAQSGVMVNNFTLDYTELDVMSSSPPPGSLNLEPSFAPIQGANSVYLESVFALGPASITQEGDVPETAKSLHFEVAHWGDGPVAGTAPLPAYFTASLGGENLALHVVGNVPGAVELAADVSAWAGQTANLSIGVTAPSGSTDFEFWGEVDSVFFSPTAVPEPSTTALAGLALAGWFLRRECRYGSCA